MKLKRALTMIMATTLSVSMLAACSSKPEEAASTEPTTPAVEKQPAKDVKLSFMTNVVGVQADSLKKAVDDFAAKTGYTVEFSAPGKSYEELMKTKMSSNTMPDLFTTHGWSVARYSEYLEPVNDMAFASRISDQMKSVISDKNGKMYVLPIDADIAGMIYNEDVLKAAGVNVDDIKTWTDFEAAAAKIKGTGKEVVSIGGKDVWTIGQFFDWVAPSFYVTNDSNNKREELKSGKFDTATWEQVAGLMDKWTKAGYFNKDVLTADYNGDMAALANGEAAFSFYGNSSIVDAKKLNPNAKLGMMPIPAADASDTPTLIAGERVAVGVWKDSKNKAEAIELLNYLATPEVAVTISDATGNPSGLKGVKGNLGDIQQFYDKYASVRTLPYFDREYLPSGMWDVMCATGADILAGKGNSVKNAAKVMEQNFNDKYVK
ncbi:extracellular solute-binding protein [Paenibacillus sp.]|uniref:ABC transporter substrate-binding protein n=1 Tax=Paenibacillus sp. TaxID=58172 RepID=UPI0028AD14DB|nr:extracellular solute-binding protein [Paenibacillus sp.]